MISTLKKLFWLYQKSAFYASKTKGEYAKIGSFIPETLTIYTALAVKGVDIPVYAIILLYILVMVIAVGVGKLLVVIGVARYDMELNNGQNPELQEILKILKK